MPGLDCHVQDTKLSNAACVTTLFSMQVSCQPQYLRSRRCLFRRGSLTIQVFLLEETPTHTMQPSKSQKFEYQIGSNSRPAQSFQVMLQRMHRRLTSNTINLPQSQLDFHKNNRRTSPESTPRHSMIRNTTQQRDNHTSPTQSQQGPSL